jgi:CheY-like chemotaxis protein
MGRKRILFVDDEAAVLLALRIAMRKDRQRWDMVFAAGGEVALAEVRKQPFDLVVSDMRMPGMDGATLLHRIKDECPATARIVLSGHADDEMHQRTVSAADQWLCKPCDTTTLRDAIARSIDSVDGCRCGHARARDDRPR